MIGDFLRWWGRQLWETLPEAWRRQRSEAAEDGVALTFEAGGVSATRRRGRRLVALGRFGTDAAGLDALRRALGPKAGAVSLLVPAAMMLEQVVPMPIAAERGISTALRWEMDRLTPFAAEAVYWSYLVEQRDRARGRLAVRLRLVPRAAVDGVLAALGGAGLAPSMLLAADGPGRRIPLAAARRRAMRPEAVAATVLAVLGAGAAAAPFVRQELALDGIAERIEVLRPEVLRAEGLRKRLADRAANADVMAAEGQRVGDALRAVALATALLPDDTYLTGFSLRERMMTLEGQSAGASKLIGILARDPAIRDPVFAAPVTRNEVTGAEAFTLRAEVRP